MFSLLLKDLISDFYLASIGLAVSKVKNNKMLNLSDLGPRPVNDLDLLYLYRFINHLVNCIYQPRHHRLHKILKKNIVLTFSHTLA